MAYIKCANNTNGKIIIILMKLLGIFALALVYKNVSLAFALALILHLQTCFVTIL